MNSIDSGRRRVRGRSHRFSLLATLASITLAGCAPTTYDASEGTTIPSLVTTTLPSGPASELLPRLSEAMKSLSSYIGPNASGKTAAGKNDVLAEIEALWSAVETEVSDSSPGTAESLGRMVDLARTAVERNRPADADKAAKFAGEVIREYLD
jgi:hypothetical protein